MGLPCVLPVVGPACPHELLLSLWSEMSGKPAQSCGAIQPPGGSTAKSTSPDKGFHYLTTETALDFEFLSAYCEPSTVLGNRETSMTKTKISAFIELRGRGERVSQGGWKAGKGHSSRCSLLKPRPCNGCFWPEGHWCCNRVSSCGRGGRDWAGGCGSLSGP